MKHTLSVLVENRFGVLARVANLFAGRGFNIDSLSVGPTEDPATSRMTIVVDDEDKEGIIEQVKKQLNKLIDTIKVIEFSSRDFVDREIVLIKISADKSNRSEIVEIVDIFRARLVDVSVKTVIVEATGSPSKIAAILELLRPYGIKELARSGKVALLRG